MAAISDGTRKSQESTDMWGSSRILPSTGTSTGTKEDEASGLKAIKPNSRQSLEGGTRVGHWCHSGFQIMNIWQAGDSGIHFLRQ